MGLHGVSSTLALLAGLPHACRVRGEHPPSHGRSGVIVKLSIEAGQPQAHAAARMVRRLAKAAGITTQIGPHSLRHSFITAALDAACRCETCRRRNDPCNRWAPQATDAP